MAKQLKKSGKGREQVEILCSELTQNMRANNTSGQIKGYCDVGCHKN
jgi:hypothetical protein